MMPQSWHTPKGNCSCLWTTSPRPAKTLGWSSVWRRQTSWAKTYWHHQSSPVMTMSSKSFTNSCTLGPPSLITSPLTLTLARGLGRQPQHLLAWHQECGQTPGWPWRRRWLCTMPASPAPCSMAVRHGPCIPIRRKGSTLSTLEAYDAYSASHGKTRWPTLMSCLALASPPCTPCWDNIGCTGLAMSAVWRMAEFQKTSSTESLPQLRSTGCLQLRYKDACKRDMKALNININSWEDLIINCTSWSSTLHKQLQTGTKKLTAVAAEKQAHKKETAANRPESMHRCNLCNQDCHSHIGLYSHRRAAQAKQTAWTSKGWIIIIHGQSWLTEAYYYQAFINVYAKSDQFHIIIYMKPFNDQIIIMICFPYCISYLF